MPGNPDPRGSGTFKNLIDINNTPGASLLNPLGWRYGSVLSVQILLNIDLLDSRPSIVLTAALT